MLELLCLVIWQMEQLTEITQPCVHMCNGLFICQLYLLPDLLEEMDCKEDMPLTLPFASFVSLSQLIIVIWIKTSVGITTVFHTGISRAVAAAMANLAAAASGHHSHHPIKNYQSLIWNQEISDRLISHKLLFVGCFYSGVENNHSHKSHCVGKELQFPTNRRSQKGTTRPKTYVVLSCWTGLGI